MFVSLTNITGYSQGAFYRHSVDLHGIVPAYPLGVRTVSAKGETGMGRLDNRLLAELAANPTYVLVTANPTFQPPKAILQAIARVCIRSPTE